MPKLLLAIFFGSLPPENWPRGIP